MQRRTLITATAFAATALAAIAAALKAHGGNKLATARQLGISRATLYERLENPDWKSAI